MAAAGATAETAALPSLVDVLVAEPLDALDAVGLQARIVAVTPQVARLQGWLQTAAGQLAHLTGGTVTVEDGGRARTAAGWLAEVQHTTAGAAGSQLRTARLLRSLPLVTAAVLDGVLTPAQAAVLTRLVDRIDAPALVEMQPQLVQVAAAMDPVQLGHWVAHLLATHCEPVLQDDLARAHERRFLQHSRDEDGSLRGRFRLSREDSEAFLTVLEPLARRSTACDGVRDDRTAGQRRADALVEVCEQVLRHGELPDAGGHGRSCPTSCPPAGPPPRTPRPPAPPAARAARTTSPGRSPTPSAAALPGTVVSVPSRACATAAWTGPQTRARIETLLCDARITRVLLTATGQVQGLQPLRDSITPAQRRALAARDLGCTARGCTRPPAMCDAHHLQRRADGGATTMDNMVLLCRRHHVLWHLGKLQLHHLTVPWHPDEQTARPCGPLDDVLGPGP
jgi:hypothetical protein